MSEILVTDSSGDQTAIDIDPGLSLMEHLRDAGYEEIQAICGGSCSCATCHVHIEGAVGTFYQMEEGEELLLELDDNFDAQKSRLSCQIELDESHNGLHVVLFKEGF